MKDSSNKALPTPQKDHDFCRNISGDYDPLKQVQAVIREKQEADNPGMAIGRDLLKTFKPF